MSQYLFIKPALAGRGETIDTVVMLRDTSLKAGDTLLRTDSTGSDSTTYSVTPKASSFLVTDSPIVLIVRFRPDSQRTYTYTCLFSKNNCQYTLRFWSEGIDTTSSTKDLFPLATSLPQTIALVASKDSTTHFVPFYNNTALPLEITGARFARALSFAIDPSKIVFPFTLGPGKSFEMPILFAPKQKGQNSDYLIVSMPNEPILQDVIPIQGFFDPSASVKVTISHATHFAIYPNPSHGEIMVRTESLVHPRVEVLDMLGRSIESASFTNDWQWNRQTSGAYFVVVSGVTESGEAEREVETVVIE